MAGTCSLQGCACAETKFNECYSKELYYELNLWKVHGENELEFEGSSFEKELAQKTIGSLLVSAEDRYTY